MEKNSKIEIGNPNLDTATLANGCFWCTEAVFQEMDGVVSVESGFSGGTVPNPTYEEVCTGKTGHAECLNIVYHKTKIGFEDLLKVYWATHDPTTLNRQGADVGTQYRSAVFYHNEEQRRIAETKKKELDASGAFPRPIVTQIVPFENFYGAGDYHKDYFRLHGENPYCQMVIRPKVEKFEKVFKDKLKKEK